MISNKEREDGSGIINASAMLFGGSARVKKVSHLGFERRGPNMSKSQIFDQRQVLLFACFLTVLSVFSAGDVVEVVAVSGYE